MIACALPACFLITMYGWPWDYWGWKTVEIQDIGSIKIPHSWVATQLGQEVYITDKPLEDPSHHVYLAGSTYIKYNEDGTKVEQPEHIPPETLFREEATERKTLDSEAFSVESALTLREYNFNGDIIQLNFLHFSGKNSMNLIAWDDTIKPSTLRKICRSYRW